MFGMPRKRGNRAGKTRNRGNRAGKPPGFRPGMARTMSGWRTPCQSAPGALWRVAWANRRASWQAGPDTRTSPCQGRGLAGCLHPRRPGAPTARAAVTAADGQGRGLPSARMWAAWMPGRAGGLAGRGRSFWRVLTSCAFLLLSSFACFSKTMREKTAHGIQQFGPVSQKHPCRAAPRSALDDRQTPNLGKVLVASKNG
jgi:hypothetical protein